MEFNSECFFSVRIVSLDICEQMLGVKGETHQ